jgi:hypothetical protein
MRKCLTTLTYRGDKERGQYIISKKISEVYKKISEVFFMSPLLFPFKILRFFVFVIVGAILVSVISPNEMSENPPQSVERSY